VRSQPLPQRRTKAPACPVPVPVHTHSAQSKRDTHRAVPPALIASLVLVFGAWVMPGASLAATRQPVASCQLPPVCLCWVLVM